MTNAAAKFDKEMTTEDVIKTHPEAEKVIENISVTVVSPARVSIWNLLPLVLPCTVRIRR